jgi:hypothetical protein
MRDFTGSINARKCVNRGATERGEGLQVQLQALGLGIGGQQLDGSLQETHPLIS